MAPRAQRQQSPPFMPLPEQPFLHAEEVREDVRLVIPAGLIRLMPLLTFVIGVLITLLWNSFIGGQWFGKNIPDRATMDKEIADAVSPIAKQLGETSAAVSDMKKYIDAKALENHEFTVAQITTAIKQAQDHSDFNRESVRGDFKQLAERVDAIRDGQTEVRSAVNDIAKRLNDLTLPPLRPRSGR